MLITLEQKIKIEMIKKNIKAAPIAHKLGVSRWTIYLVMKGIIKKEEYRKAICEATGLPMNIWDEVPPRYSRAAQGDKL